MATGREERMQQRLRGAQRHQVEDLSFGPLFPADDEEPEASATLPRTIPNSSAKRRRLDNGDASTAAPQLQTVPLVQSQPEAAPKANPYDIASQSETRTSGVSSPTTRRSSRAQTARSNPKPTSRSSQVPNTIIEEVGESPADAPGSGQRRRVSLGAAVNQSTLLQKVVAADEDDEDPFQTTSSPLTRKSRKSAATASAKSTARRSVHFSDDIDEVDELSPLPNDEVTAPVQTSSPALRASKSSRSSKGRPLAALKARSPPGLDDREAADELSPVAANITESVQTSSPLQRRSQKTAKVASGRPSTGKGKRSTRLSAENLEVDELSPEQPVRSKKPKKGPARQTKKPQQQPVEPEEADELDDGENQAEEIDEHEAAKRIGRKRPRSSLREPSVELGSQPQDEEPTAKRRRKEAEASPAKQKQPRQQKIKPKGPAQKRKSTEAKGNPIPIQVQRFTKKIQYAEDDSDTDILTADIPYSSRGGVNTVDVLSQMCEEVIEKSLSVLREAASNAPDTASRKEFRVKHRALEAFQEELRTRLLEHTIALDTMHALKKRVRDAQKEKLGLREEILRIRKEREDVALRMDAVRIKHEADSKEALHHINISSAMHDVDLAVERGQAAPELTPAQSKKADLANLELLISRVADQACTNSGSGGVLQQIKGFNAFLERAAAVLEGR